MEYNDIVRLRLANQRIAQTTFTKSEQVVAWMGAMQAQDYLGALWAVGLRTKKSTQTDVARALAERKIIRTWPMRGTLHFVAAEDARWMLELMTPKVIRAMSLRMHQLQLDDAILEKARKIIVRVLHGGKQLTRPELYEALERGGVSATSQRGYHMLTRIAHEQLICFGAHQEKQPTFALFDEWAPKTKSISTEEAREKLAIRYFTSHGPATIADVGWWSGLKILDIKAGIASAGKKLVSHTIDGVQYWMGASIPDITHDASVAHLLPPFDEYLVAYKDRDAAIDRQYFGRVNPGSNGMFSPIVVINGRVVGIWKRTIKKDGVHIAVFPFADGLQTRTQRDAIAEAAERYGTFLGLAVKVQV